MRESIPLCEAANPFPCKPNIKVPALSCDTHAHVFGPQCLYQYTQNRTYTPPDAPVGAYLHLHNQLGIERGVLVQPSVYGTDNELQLATLQYLHQLKKQYKGIAVVDANVSEAELDRLADNHYCGVRLNLLFKGGIEWRDVEKLAQRLAARDWHLQLLVDVSDFEFLKERISGLPLKVVFDHMGHMNCAKGVNNPGFKTLLNLVEDGKAWVKLSGAYRISNEVDVPYSDVTPFAQALAKANIERCVWGSDWPHPHFSKAMPEYASLLNLLSQWLANDDAIKKVLVDNPANLYGF